jgi:hypothetical protein
MSITADTTTVYVDGIGLDEYLAPSWDHAIPIDRVDLAELQRDYYAAWTAAAESVIRRATGFDVTVRLVGMGEAESQASQHPGATSLTTDEQMDLELGDIEVWSPHFDAMLDEAVRHAGE